MAERVFLKTLTKGIMCWVAGRSNQNTTGFMTEKVSSNGHEKYECRIASRYKD